MRLVYRWVMDERAVAEAVAILHAHGKHRWGDTAEQICGEARKTVATVRMSMSRALSFLDDPQLAQCVLPADGAGFDITAFLRSRGTLYMIASPAGSKDQAPVSGLFAALASEIRYQATLLAAQTTGKRLDPPLLMALDEACQICPCPIPSWVADSGGKGVTIVTVAHGLAQLRDQYSADAAQTIVDCAGTLMLFGGTKDPQTLDLFSRLCGPSSFDQQSRRRGEPGQRHLTEHPLMTDAMIRRLPRSHTLLVRDDCSPVISRAPLAWRDLRMIRAKIARRAVATVQPLAADLAEPAPGHAPRPAVQGTLPVPVGSPPRAPASNGHGTGHRPAGGGHDAR
jgi:type IV secretory pathway TraG/TraD family ATPase VirD4